jgi:hypothetical protein
MGAENFPQGMESPCGVATVDLALVNVNVKVYRGPNLIYSSGLA